MTVVLEKQLFPAAKKEHLLLFVELNKKALHSNEQSFP